VVWKASALAAVLVVLCAVPAAASSFSPGSPGAGDPFFPLAGNGGYDARHYSLDLRWDRPANRLTGHAAMFAVATQGLSRFDLDLRDFYAVSRVTVNGRPAAFSQHDGQELTIRPRSGLRRGTPFVAVVDYAGTPEAIVDPDDSLEGWVATDDGAMVVNEPQGAPGWMPVNDTPRDKASYDFNVTVPAGSTVMGNGVLLSHTTRGATTTWRWVAATPMASYLTTITNGPFDTRFGRTPWGLPRYDAVDPDIQDDDGVTNPALAWERLSAEPDIVRFFSSLYGAYPFESVGGIIDNAPDVGYSLESQTRVNYAYLPDATTVVHELSHQWFGDAVTPRTWPDIWLNEGFATWSEWIYSERHGGEAAQEFFDELYATPPGDDFDDLWYPAPAALPGPADLFGTPVYERGAMTLQALRKKIGDATFFDLLRTWYRDHRGGNVSTGDFIALAERKSGRDLRAFFDAWLYREGKPTRW
jgi:aminopeptidase N